ncbi:MAG TPA: serine/threonine-protein kinase [Burkholderiales bacterium]|nr:serine/threonine-protein kinase [Burkholderiales bacterium]
MTQKPAFELDLDLDIGLSLQVGKYEVQKLLGKGATGTVYLARDTFTGREVALKTIEPEVFRDAEFGTVYRSQFLQEASLAGKLRHPHIVAILDAVVAEDSGHIAMEYVTGGDLSKHAAPESLLPVADVLQIGFKCCGALEYAAKEGIVHRDIKPANIMLVADTDIKIADFGAASLKRTQHVTTTRMGSPYYMSPEQLQSKPASFQSDMYSLGVVLYELLTGRRPFLAENMQALMDKIVKLNPVPPSEVRRDLPREIDAVVLRAMKKSPEQRYPSWAAFAAELSKLGEQVLPRGTIPDSEKYVALKTVNMLATLSDYEVWELVRAGRWSRVDKGKVVVRENEPGTSFFFLARGQAKVTLQGRLLNMLNDRECFGEMAYISGGAERRHATVEAMTPLLLAEFAPAALEKMSLGAQLQLTRAVVRNVVDRLELANKRIGR